jgi:hypothetical protein
MQADAQPCTYPNWRKDPMDRAEDAAYLFGYFLMKHCRDEALAELPVNASEEIRTIVVKAVDTALHNVCDLLEGYWTLEAGRKHRAELMLAVRILDGEGELVESQEISPAKLDLPIGYWKWAKDREFQ